MSVKEQQHSETVPFRPVRAAREVELGVGGDGGCVDGYVDDG